MDTREREVARRCASAQGNSAAKKANKRFELGITLMKGKMISKGRSPRGRGVTHLSGPVGLTMGEVKELGIADCSLLSKWPKRAI